MKTFCLIRGNGVPKKGYRETRSMILQGRSIVVRMAAGGKWGYGVEERTLLER